MDGFDVDPEVTNAFRAQVEPLCSVATGLVTTMWAMREGAGHIPSEHSRAMGELARERTLAGAWGDGPARLAHSIAVLQLMGAEEGIHAVCELLLADRASIFSHLTVARSALEFAGRSMWLSEPALELRARVARVMTERLYSIDQEAQLASQMKAERLVKKQPILDTARRFNFDVPNEHTVAERRPSQRTATWRALKDPDDSGLGETLYRYYAAVSHGTVWGLLQSIDRRDAPGISLGPPLRLLKVTSRETNIVTAALVMAYMNAGGQLAILMGWATDEWIDAFTTAALTIREFLASLTARTDQ